MCLAQRHNTVTPVRLEPAAPLSQVKDSTTEPLRSQWCISVLILANSEDPDEMQHYAAFHLRVTVC